MKRIQIAFLLALTLALLSRPYITLYGNANTYNAGILIGPDRFMVGYETRGDPGPLVCFNTDCYPPWTVYEDGSVGFFDLPGVGFCLPMGECNE